MRKRKRILSMLLVLSLILSMTGTGEITKAAKKPVFQKTKVTLQVGGKTTLKIKNSISGSKKSFKSSNKKIATVSGKGVVKAIAKGKTVITCKITKGSSKYTLKAKVTVNKASTDNSSKITIREAAAGGFTFGSAVNGYQLSDAKTLSFIKKEFNSITFENEMKPDSMMVQSESQKDPNGEPAINTSKLNTLLTYARDNGLKVRGHCLVWHSQTPDWFFKEGYSNSGAYVSKAVLEKRMQIYIKKMIEFCQTNYSGVVYAWDVVNEAIDGNNYRSNSKWYSIFGSEEYIEKAFTYARQYATQGQKLFYNDYSEYDSGKRDLIYTLCKGLKEKGVLDGIGMQSHWDFSSTMWNAAGKYPDPSVLKAAIDKFASIQGIEIQLTEIDLHCSSDDSKTQAKLASRYFNLFKVIMDAKKNGANITNLTFWGLTDATTWLSSFKGTSYPLLFDGNFKRKKAYYAVLAAVQGKSTYTP